MDTTTRENFPLSYKWDCGDGSDFCITTFLSKLLMYS